MTHRIKMNADGSKDIRQTTKTVQQAIRDARLYGLPVETRHGSNFVVIGDQVFVGEPCFKLDAHQFAELVIEEIIGDPSVKTSASAGKRIRELLEGQDPYSMLHALVLNLSGAYVTGTGYHKNNGYEKFGEWIKRTRLSREDLARDVQTSRMTPPPAAVPPKRNPPKATAKAQPKKAAK